MSARSCILIRKQLGSAARKKKRRRKSVGWLEALIAGQAGKSSGVPFF
jgi:hypothetical protein